MRNLKAEKKMIEDVYLKNVIARCADLNSKNKIAALPDLGIFWMSLDGKSFFKSTVSIRNADKYGEFRIYDTPHYTEWNKAVRANPKWRGKEYEEIPRGRVVLHVVPNDNTFIVYMPKQLKKHENKVLREFRLPRSMTEFDYSDIHYRI